ncbi:MAG: hypothetical protein PF637_05460 [Spirochaetes bacterium]|jgi:regulator of extracellular matrix RemA (YlzA/DUF370 family)|nr:hypothetical protein [Spirochaetota bacterium]
MIFHIGKREVISFDSIIGIFNSESIEISEYNNYYKEEMNSSTRSIIVDCDDEIISSEISSYTLMEREIINSTELLWKRGKYVG